MEEICKPHLVDLLRTFDKNRWFSPRIRFASIRSKNELIADLSILFHPQKLMNVIHFVPKHSNKLVPPIEYDLEGRHYRIDGRTLDIPRLSREKPKFQISRVPYTMSFP